jgi:hypothetical protein
VSGAKTQRWETRVDIGEVVVMIGDVEFARVLAAVAVRVADERAFPVVGELVPGDGDAVRSMGDIE